MKEKLVELIRNSHKNCKSKKTCHECEQYGNGSDCVYLFMADELIAHGVTVQCEIDANTFRLMRECERLKEEKESLANAVNVLEEINSDLYKKLRGVSVQKWISVKDRLPIEEAKAHEQEWCEEYCEFLVMIERGLLPTTLYYDWENNEWFRINTALERETYKVTHWMPLPNAQKGE